MNKTVLKNFATWSRRKLIEQVQTKALLYGIDEKNGLHIEEQFGQLLINGQTYPLSMKPAFTALQKQLEQKGYKQLLEEAAYTWFNRIIAIRYMEVHEYLPERVNVLSSSVGRVDPDILFEYDTMDLTIEQEEVRELINAGNTEAAYRILFVAQCNALNRILPFMFEPIQDYTELLLPDFLLDAESVIKTLIQNEELTESFAEIEVIGWLYQYYIAEEKDRVFAQKMKYKKEEIPFATQLFTPKWIVQYMVQNSLGRYWTEAHREDEDLIDNWEYFIKHEEEDFHEKIAPYVNKELKVEDIKLLDPAMGSGHILVYAFEVFHEIYEKCGYLERDIPRLILENNLYGLDIDDRAYQLAAFAVVMKAASYSKRFLRSIEREGIELNLASIQETNHISDDVIAYIAMQEVGEQYNLVKAFFDQYHNAKTYGSLINVTEQDISFIEGRFEQIFNNPVEDLFYSEQHEIAKQVFPALINQTKIMRNEYDVVVMNPPYVNSTKIEIGYNQFLRTFYNLSKADSFSAFIEYATRITHSQGIIGCMSPFVWMFINAYKDLREFIVEGKSIDNLILLEYSAFEEATVPICTFILRNDLLDLEGVYIKLSEFKGKDSQEIKALEAIKNRKKVNYVYCMNQKLYNKIPNKNIGFWIDSEALRLFDKSDSLDSEFTVRNGITTGKNDSYLRYWFEVGVNKKNKWYPCNKGGEFRKWYGNLNYVIDWENDGEKLKNTKKSDGTLVATLRGIDFNFKKGITMSRITSADNSFRILPEGYITESAANNIYLKEECDEGKLYKLLGYLNSKVVKYLLNVLNPTLNIVPNDINNLPINFNQIDFVDLVKENITISKKDWDSFETSKDFEIHPFLKFNEIYLADAFRCWEKSSLLNFKQLKENEEKINSALIEAFGLQGCLTPTLQDFEISLNKADRQMDTKSFLSYFIGCLVGRYNLKDLKFLSNREFQVDLAIINFTTDRYYQNDIIDILREFMATVFSSNTVDENIQWIAEALEMKNGEDAESRIRRYFLDEFFTDHCKMYQKRPIYWLVDSGKQKGLRTLIYMHRYQPDTMATIRFEHLQEIQAKYQQEINDIENRLVNPNLSATDKKKLNAEKVSFEKKIEELREFDKRLAEFATAALPINLDDGVKVNYEKFYRGGKGVLAKIK